MAADDRATWHVGADPRRHRHPGQDRSATTSSSPTEEIAASRLDYLALGHWHSSQQGKAGAVTYAYAGAPEPVALDQDRAGKVLLIELDETDGRRTTTVTERVVGKTRFERVQIDAATVVSQAVLVTSLAKRADPDLVLDARLVGVRPDELDIDIDEIEAELASSFLKVRVRDISAPALHGGDPAVAGHGRGRVHPRSRGAHRGVRGRRSPPTRRPRCATPFASVGCSLPDMRSRCEGPQAPAARLPAVPRSRHRLRAGPDVVRGPNESGKTTIQRAIELAITRRVTSAASDLSSLRPWDAAEESPSIVTIDFEEDQDGPIKTGTLEKTFAGTKGTVRLDYDGQSITDPTLADQVLAEMTGIPTEAFFRSTASVRHAELSDLARDEASLHDRLQASISGADRGTSFAKRKLEKGLHDLNTKGDKNPGRLKVAETAVAQATTAVAGGEAALAQLAQDRDMLAGALVRRSDAETALVERRALLEKARQAERLIGERDAAQQRYDRFRQAVEVNEELSRLATSHPSPQPLPIVRAGVERLRTLDVRARELRAALAGEVNVQFEVAPEARWQPYRTWSIPLILIGLILAIGSGVATAVGAIDVGPVVTIAGAVIAGIGAALAFVAWRMRRGAKTHTELRDVEIDRRLRGRSEMEAELFQVEQETARRLGTFGLDDLPAVEALLAREEAHVGQIERLTAQIEGLVGKEPPETLAPTRDAAALDVGPEDQRPRCPRPDRQGAASARAPRGRGPRSEALLEKARDDEANARARVEANADRRRAGGGTAERLAMWREQLASLERRNRVYETTLRSIEARRAGHDEDRDPLPREAHGRRPRARRPPAATATSVSTTRRSISRSRAPERGDWVKVSSLSQGTLDLVYLTARLGLVRLVTGDRRPPLDPGRPVRDARRCPRDPRPRAAQGRRPRTSRSST